jgi:DNA-binding transcriptional MerR regulator
MSPTGAVAYPIGAVARMTGLPLDTLRAWERRHRVVTPSRDARGRRYTEADVKRLTRLAALVDAGHPIGSLAGHSDAALARLVERVAAPAPATAAAPAVDLAPLLRAIKQYDQRSLDELLARSAVLLSGDHFVFTVVLPMLREAGERWASRAWCPAHEHLASEVARGVLVTIRRTTPRPAGAPIMLLTTASGERHELGLLCAGVLAARAGWHTVYLGPDLPARHVVQAAGHLGADVVVVSATAVDGDAADLRGLKPLPPATALWAGGPRSALVRKAVGRRVREIGTLEAFAALAARRHG